MNAFATGLRIREKRRELGMKQVELARAAEVSASYLNLIEANKRRINGALLNRIAKALDTTTDDLSGAAQSGLVATLADMAADPALAQEDDLTHDLEGVTARYPGWARIAARAYQRLNAVSSEADLMADRLANDPALGGAVHDMLTEVSALRSTSEILYEAGSANDAATDPGAASGLDAQQRRRFEEILFQQSQRLAATGAALARYFDETAERRRLRSPISDAEEALAAITDLPDRIEREAVAARRYILRDDEDIAHALRRATRDRDLRREKGPDLGWLEERDARALAFSETRFNGLISTVLDECAEALNRESGDQDDAGLNEETRTLISREIIRRAADAVLAPIEEVAAHGRDCNWDMERMERRYDGDAGLVMRRIACAIAPGAETGGRAMHIRIDGVGRTLARRGALRLAPQTRQLDCPFWPLHRAPSGGFAAFAVIRHDEGRAFAIARRRLDGMATDMLLLNESAARATGYASAAQETPQNVGADCRICAHKACEWRREPFVAGDVD